MGELDGIAQEIAGDLSQTGGVPQQPGVAGRALPGDGQPGLHGLGFKQVDHTVQQTEQIERPLLQRELAGINLGQVQNVVDQGQQGTAAFFQRSHLIALLGCQLAMG